MRHVPNQEVPVIERLLNVRENLPEDKAGSRLNSTVRIGNLDWDAGSENDISRYDGPSSWTQQREPKIVDVYRSTFPAHLLYGIHP